MTEVVVKPAQEFGQLLLDRAIQWFVAKNRLQDPANEKRIEQELGRLMKEHIPVVIEVGGQDMVKTKLDDPLGLLGILKDGIIPGQLAKPSQEEFVDSLVRSLFGTRPGTRRQTGK
jgi:hypothetical protein